MLNWGPDPDMLYEQNLSIDEANGTQLRVGAFTSSTGPTYVEAGPFEWPQSMSIEAGKLQIAARTNALASIDQRARNSFILGMRFSTTPTQLMFTVSGITSAITDPDWFGHQYFTDSFRVLCDGSTIVPHGVVGAELGHDGLVSGVEGADGEASFSCESPELIEIVLNNAYGGTIPRSARAVVHLEISPLDWRI